MIIAGSHHLVIGLFTIVHLIVNEVYCDEHEYRLMDDLTRNYNKKIRPSLNHSEATNITFGLALSQIIDVDEKNQILTTNCWLNQHWLDYKLRWDPNMYGGIKAMRIPFRDVWRPDILLYNNADVLSYMSSISSNMIVTSDGNVTWLNMVIFKSSCAINVKFFPFDEQNCSMLFASWASDGYLLNLIHNTEAGDDSNYIQNSEWELMNLTQIRHVQYYSCCDEPYPDITYYIHIRRRPLFYVFNMMLPCVLITLVALLGFYIPSESGEKVTMGITTLLSMTVFLMLVAESMPPTKNQLPLLGLYYGITIAIVSFATAMTVLTLNIHHKGVRGREVPWIIRKICFDYLAKALCLTIKTPPSDTFDDMDIISDSYNSPSKKSLLSKMASQFCCCNTRSNIMENTDTKYDDHHHQHTNDPPSPYSAYYKHNRHATSSSNAHSTPGGGGGCSHETLERTLICTMQKLCATMERNDIRIAEQEHRDAIKIEWQQVALVIDRLLLWCFVIVTVTVTLAIMLQAPAYFLSHQGKEIGKVAP